MSPGSHPIDSEPLPFIHPPPGGGSSAQYEQKRLLNHLEVMMRITPASVIERRYIGPLASIMAEQHRELGLPLTCLMVGLVTVEDRQRLRPEEMLGELAQFVRRDSRKSDRVSYYAGDAVAILLSGESVQGGMNVARRMVELWPARMSLGPWRYHTAIGIGVSGLGELTWSGEEVLRQAHLALETARLRGAGEICHYGESQPGVPTAFMPLQHQRGLADNFPRLASYLSNRGVRTAFDHAERCGQHFAGFDIMGARMVAERSIELARALDLSPEEQAAVAAAALVRDVGMAQVPSPILAAVGPLQAGQRQLIREHPQISNSNLKGLPLAAPSPLMVLQHHERVDGTGYPRGLDGDDILRGSKIITIVDAYQAMTTDRAYRPNALSDEAARAELRRGAGTQFDPVLVDAFLSL